MSARASNDIAAELLEALALENAQLREALTSRIVIEQAKGMLAERFELDVEQAFMLLRRAARSNHVRVHDLAATVIQQKPTPFAIKAVANRGPNGVADEELILS